MFAALLLSLTIAAAAPPAIRESLNIRYHDGSPRQVLDVFSPPASGDRLSPVILFVHGGTWMAGDKDFYGETRNAGRMFARNGYVAVLANYRLTPAVRHPEHARDVARAFAWVVRNAARHGGDPSRIILAGHSAGGHLVSLIATDPAYLADPALKLTEKERAAIKGVVCLSGIYRIPDAATVSRMANVVLERWRESPEGSLERLAAPLLAVARPVLNPFWLVFGMTDEAHRKASPICHVRKGLPPFLLFYCEYEPATLDEMARDFARELIGRGVSAEVKCIEGARHRYAVRRLHEPDDVVARAALDFIGRAIRR